jgi:hypothetical protein
MQASFEQTKTLDAEEQSKQRIWSGRAENLETEGREEHGDSLTLILPIGTDHTDTSLKTRIMGHRKIGEIQFCSHSQHSALSIQSANISAKRDNSDVGMVGKGNKTF